MLEVNFEVGIILPRGTPARSGVMHSISSMPRAFSQRAASFQSATPRAEAGEESTVGFFARLVLLLWVLLAAFMDIFLAGIFLAGCHCGFLYHKHP